jgi:hypothetical protein
MIAGVSTTITPEAGFIVEIFLREARIFRVQRGYTIRDSHDVAKEGLLLLGRAGSSTSDTAGNEFGSGRLQGVLYRSSRSRGDASIAIFAAAQGGHRHASATCELGLVEAQKCTCSPDLICRSHALYSSC